MASGFVGLGFRVRGAGINLQASFLPQRIRTHDPSHLRSGCFAEASNCPYLPSSFNQIWRHVWSSQNLKTLNEAPNPEPSTQNSLNTKPQIPETLNPRPRIPQTPNPNKAPPPPKEKTYKRTLSLTEPHRAWAIYCLGTWILLLQALKNPLWCPYRNPLRDHPDGAPYGRKGASRIPYTILGAPYYIYITKAPKTLF